MKALAISQGVAEVDLQVAKNFTGDGYGTEAKTVAGLTNVIFDLLANGQSQFPQGEHFLLGSLRVYSGINASVPATDWVAGVNDITLKNATLDIVINGVVEWRDIPLLVFTASAEQNDSGQLPFLDPKFWYAQTNAEIRITAPVAMTANLNVKFQFGGPKLIS